jgi:hypothetical protein
MSLIFGLKGIVGFIHLTDILGEKVMFNPKLPGQGVITTCDSVSKNLLTNRF